MSSAANPKHLQPYPTFIYNLNPLSLNHSYYIDLYKVTTLPPEYFNSLSQAQNIIPQTLKP
jgi:hypothetical protein